MLDDDGSEYESTERAERLALNPIEQKSFPPINYLQKWEISIVEHETKAKLSSLAENIMEGWMYSLLKGREYRVCSYCVTMYMHLLDQYWLNWAPLLCS